MMQKNQIIEKLRDRGCRITRQRRILLDIILEGDCASCKEIYYKAHQSDENIGFATVYRMLNILEEIGAISRRNVYRVSCENLFADGSVCVVELDDGTTCRLAGDAWYNVMREGLKTCGYIVHQNISCLYVQKTDEGDG